MRLQPKGGGVGALRPAEKGGKCGQGAARRGAAQGCPGPASKAEISSSGHLRCRGGRGGPVRVSPSVPEEPPSSPQIAEAAHEGLGGLCG